MKKKKKVHRRLLSEPIDDDTQIVYRYNDININIIKRCKLFNRKEVTDLHEMCISYDLDSHLFKLNLIYISKKVLREKKGIAFRKAINALSVDKKERVDIYDMKDNDDDDGQNILNTIVSFEPINKLGGFISRLEAMD